MLQIFGTVDFWGPLILPSYNVFMASVPVYLVLFIVVALILTFSVIRLKEHQIDIFDSDYARHIAVLCQTPRTTEYLREKYEEWRHGIFVQGGYNFDDYMKQLEKQGFLKYASEKWEVTNKAKGYLRKYTGGYSLNTP
jgi:hypothetical protein